MSNLQIAGLSCHPTGIGKCRVSRNHGHYPWLFGEVLRLARKCGGQSRSGGGIGIHVRGAQVEPAPVV